MNTLYYVSIGGFTGFIFGYIGSAFFLWLNKNLSKKNTYYRCDECKKYPPLRKPED